MPFRRSLLLTGALALGLVAPWAHAAKDDRQKPLNLVFDKQGEVDKVKQRAEFNGNVIMTKGSLMLRAERMDVQETSDGYYQAYATGATARQVQFRQDRDTPGERIEGRADQIEYDTRSETMRLVGNAEAKVMRGDQLMQTMSGASLNYDNRTERLVVETGASSPHPSGRGRVVLMPRNPPAEPAPAASEPLGLRPSMNLTPRQPQP
ncbi:lipopolysaccharide transport periplasmic protein LptA [Roseateles amylovorans]|jgi:lipopolysaccharide export system protein LptA|uniref:Lipopolysaccharide export system protein LptA n=1 Tax=Roseateles amylovorans TaxID=2978473 RepID=A0ABY6AZL9_9BURK|nr:lipopolysaccharide transport periplasmic protein LptA [Roseateles amylovorans]UXH78137.1 lipopolysaccharide transport periplasmic protein LptA [Roseateles amylovorans]